MYSCTYSQFRTCGCATCVLVRMCMHCCVLSFYWVFCVYCQHVLGKLMSVCVMCGILSVSCAEFSLCYLQLVAAILVGSPEACLASLSRGPPGRSPCEPSLCPCGPGPCEHSMGPCEPGPCWFCQWINKCQQKIMDKQPCLNIRNTYTTNTRPIQDCIRPRGLAPGRTQTFYMHSVFVVYHFVCSSLAMCSWYLSGMFTSLTKSFSA